MSAEVSPWASRFRIISLYNCTTGQCADVLSSHSYANTYVTMFWNERGPGLLDICVSLPFLFIMRKAFGSPKLNGKKLYYTFLLLILLTSILKKVLVLTFLGPANRVWCSDDDDGWCRWFGFLSFVFNYVHYFSSVVFLFEICVALHVQSRFIPEWLYRAPRVKWYFGTMGFTLLAYGLFLYIVFGFGKSEMGCSLRATNPPRSREMLPTTAKIAYLWPFPTASVLCIMLLYRIGLKLTVNREGIVDEATKHRKPLLLKLMLFVPFVLLPYELDTWYKYAFETPPDCHGNERYQVHWLHFFSWLRYMNGSFICLYVSILSHEVRSLLCSFGSVCPCNKNSGTTEGQERLGSVLLGGVYISDGERLSHADYGDESDEDAFPDVGLKQEYLPPLLAGDGSDFRPDDVDD